MVIIIAIHVVYLDIEVETPLQGRATVILLVKDTEQLALHIQSHSG